MDGTMREANQPRPFGDVDLFGLDAPLQDAMRLHGVEPEAEQLHQWGRDWGALARFEEGRLANEYPPVLHTLDARGERADEVEFHPAWHGLMARSIAGGLHDAQGPALARAARLYMAAQAEAGHICPLTMTHASLAVLNREPARFASWRAGISGRRYDPRLVAPQEKGALTIGMGMTERQGGTDVRSNETRAIRTGEDYGVTGEKWFMSAPMCDAFLVLAQAPEGLTCFLMPRFRPDGTVNALHFVRLKDKLGNRSNASSEVRFENAFARRIGAEGAGIRTIIDMVQHTRVDCAVSSAGLMRLGLSVALHHARQRIVFGKALAGQPAMRAVLADMALEVEASVALVFRLVAAVERAGQDEAEAAYARLMTPAVKYLVCKSAPRFLYEAMECLGGNGYVEDFTLARAYREAPVNAIWEGSGNVMALDVLRAASRAPDASEALIGSLMEKTGHEGSSIGADILRMLRGNEAERHARRSTERLARLAAMAALRAGAPELADAYGATRLSGEMRETYGCADLGALEARLLERVLPAE